MFDSKQVLTGTNSNIAGRYTQWSFKTHLREIWKRVKRQIFAFETCVSQNEGRNAVPVEGYVMLYVQIADVDDIAVLMPSGCF